jgi:hypothetical protein
MIDEANTVAPVVVGPEYALLACLPQDLPSWSQRVRTQLLTPDADMT